VTGADKLSEVEIEEEEYDSIAHLDVIAADGGVPPTPCIEPTFSLCHCKVMKQREHGSWRKLMR
jgi:hypothetical protein